MKICRLCNSQKAIEYFSINKLNRDGRDTRCKDCRAILYRASRSEILRVAKEKYDSNPELFRSRRRLSSSIHAKERNFRRRSRRCDDSRKRQNKKRHETKELCFTILGGKCSVCGISDTDILCVDHVNNDGSEERFSGISNISIWRKIIRGEETGRYQALCFNCNLEKFINRDYKSLETGVLKRCKTCNTYLDNSHFNNHPKYHDGKYYECIRCSRFRSVIIKSVAMSRVGDCFCLSCGNSSINSLTLDHINNDGSASRSNDGLGKSLYRKIISGCADASRFQILCMNCNIKKHVNYTKRNDFIIKKTSVIHDDFSISGDYYDFSSFDLRLLDINSIHNFVLFCEKYHNLGYGKYGSINIGCYFNNVLVSAAKFSTPSFRKTVASVGLSFQETLELDMICVHPKLQNSVFTSFFLSELCKKVRIIRPDINFLLGFYYFCPHYLETSHVSTNWKKFLNKRKPSRKKLGDLKEVFKEPSVKFVYRF